MKPSEMFDMFRRRGGARCVEVGRLVQRHLDGRLDEATSARVVRHLDACRRCGLAAQDYRQLKAALGTSSEQVPEAPLERLRALVAELASGEPPP